MQITTLLARLAIGLCGCVAGYYAAYSAFRNGQNYAPGYDGMVIGAAFAAVVILTWFILPVAKDLGFWERWSARAGWLLLTAFVLTNAIGFTATHRTSTVGDKQNTITAFNAAQQGYEQATERLTAMKGNRRWESTKGCTDVTVEQSAAFCDQFSETQAKADKLQAIVSAGKPATSDAQADTIGWVIQADTATVSKAQPIFMAIVIDLAATLAWYLVMASKSVPVNVQAPVAKPVARREKQSQPVKNATKKPTARKSRKVEQKRKRTPTEKAAKQVKELKKLTKANPASFKAPVRIKPNGKPDRRFRIARPANANERVDA